MPFDRQRPVPRERTFAELFPWRNMRRALMLVLLIVAIVAIKRSTSGFLGRVGALWGNPSAAPGASGDSRSSAETGRLQGAPRVRLGPGLAPHPSPVAVPR